jgi:hypothetical protein
VLAHVVRASTHGIRGNAQCNGVPTAQIDHAERAPHGDVDMHIGVQIRSTWEEHACLTDIEDAEASRRILARIREPTRRKTEPQRARKAVKEDMMPGSEYGLDAPSPKCFEGTPTSELAMVLPQETKQAPRIVAEQGEEAWKGREELPLRKHPPTRVRDAALGGLQAQELVALSLQTDALLGHVEPFRRPFPSQRRWRGW